VIEVTSMGLFLLLGLGVSWVYYVDAVPAFFTFFYSKTEKNQVN